MILSILSKGANPPLCNFAIPLFPPYFRPLPSASHFSITRSLLSFHMITPWTSFCYHFLSLHLLPFPWDSAGEWIWESPSKKDETALTSWKFSECTKYKGLPLLFFSKFFTFSSVVIIRGHCVTPQEMLKVRRHQDLRYYFFTSHAILSWNISLQSVIDFSSVKLNLVNFSLKIRHLVATKLMIFLKISWSNIMHFMQ